MRKMKLMSKIGAVALSMAMVAGSFVVMPAKNVEAAENAGISSGITGYYSFDDSLENSITGGSAKLHNGAGADWNTDASGTPAYVTGKNGKAYSFTGDTTVDGVTTKGLGLELDVKLTNAFSISYWVNADTVTSATSMVFSPIDGSTDMGLNIADNWFGKTFPTVRIWGVKDSAGTAVAETYMDNWTEEANSLCGKWVYVTLTYDTDGSTVLYIDGKQVGTGKSYPGAFLEDSVFLGINFWDASFDGAMDDFLVYNRALTATEVAGLYAANGDISKFGNITSVENMTIEVTDAAKALTVVKDSAAQVVTYASSDEKVATVDATGKVTPVSPGTATITVVSGNVKTATVTVVKSMTGITLDNEKASVLKGATTTLTYTVAPEDTTDKPEITFATSDDKVATVDATGKVTAVGDGTATITVTAKVGDKTFTDTCAVTVTAEANPITGITATIDKATLDLATDSTKANVKVEYAIKDATKEPTDNKAVTYTSSDEKVATVDKNGVVTAVGKGTATITAALENGQKATVTVTVTRTIKIESELDVPSWWAAHTTGVEVTEEGIQLTFKNTTYADAKDSFNGPVYVLYTSPDATIKDAGDEGYTEYAVVRGDLYGWCGAANTGTGIDAWKKLGYTFEANKTVEDWAPYITALKAGQNCTVTAKLVDGKVQVKMKVGDYVSTATYKVDTTKPVYISLSGEKTKLTNIKVSAIESTSNNTSTVATAVTKEEVAKMVATVKGATADSVIKLDAITDTNEITKVESFKASTLKGLTFQAIDIKLMKGTEAIQPGATVTVTVTVPEALKNAKEIKVFRLDTVDGKDSLTPVKVVEFKDGNVSFETDHFSTYVFAATTVKSGDTAPVVAVVLLACVAAAAVLVSKKRRVTE